MRIAAELPAITDQRLNVIHNVAANERQPVAGKALLLDPQPVDGPPFADRLLQQRHREPFGSGATVW